MNMNINSSGIHTAKALYYWPTKVKKQSHRPGINKSHHTNQGADFRYASFQFRIWHIQSKITNWSSSDIVNAKAQECDTQASKNESFEFRNQNFRAQEYKVWTREENKIMQIILIRCKLLSPKFLHKVKFRNTHKNHHIKDIFFFTCNRWLGSAPRLRCSDPIILDWKCIC